LDNILDLILTTDLATLSSFQKLVYLKCKIDHSRGGHHRRDA
jgi:hypothetical protein